MDHPADDGERAAAQGDSLAAARAAIREGDIALAHSIALDRLPDCAEESFDADPYIQTLHLLGDTLATAGEYDDALHIYEDALIATRDLLPEGPARDLQQSLLHISLADIALITTADLAKKEAMEQAVYVHTSTAMNLLAGHPWGNAARTARFFAYRSTMIASLMQNDTGSADFMHMQMEMLATSYGAPDAITHYHDTAMAIAAARLSPDAPTVEISVLHEIPPLSAYVPLSNT